MDFSFGFSDGISLILKLVQYPWQATGTSDKNTVGRRAFGTLEPLKTLSG
jgi:hypothetical protein